MKFTAATGIETTEFQVVIGYSSAGDPKKDTVKLRAFIDGDFSALDFGARQERVAEFTMINIEKSKFVTLANYFIENAGEKVPIQVRDGENLFPGVTGGGVGNDEYLVYILEPKQLQEEDFSVTRELFSIRLKIALASAVGASETVPNVKGSQKIDILVKIDTILADFVEDDSPGPTAEYVGQRWLDITSEPGTLKRWNGTSWISLYQVAPDDVDDLGFYRGSFYLSAFADLDFNLNDPPLEETTRSWKSGLITYKGVRLPGQSVDISGGPTFARREGFEFSLDNADKLSHTVIVDKINLYGAKCTVWVYNNGVVTKIRSARNKTNDFSYTDYKFRAEPFMLDDEGDFPSDLIKSSPGGRYDSIKADMEDTPVVMTYGQHEFAFLQNISTDSEDVKITRTTSTGSVGNYPTATGKLQSSKTVIKMNESADSDVNQYAISPKDLMAINDNGFIYTLRVIGDTNTASQNNVGKVRRVVAPITLSAGEYSITIDEELPDGPQTGPDSILTFAFKKVRYRFQIEGGVDNKGEPSEEVRACGGFGSLDHNAEGELVFLDKIDLFRLSESERDLLALPSTDYSINTPSNNIITLNPRAATDPSTIVTYKEVKDEGRPFSLNTLDILGDYNPDFNAHMDPSIPAPSGTEGTFTPTTPISMTYAEKVAFIISKENHFAWHRNIDDSIPDVTSANLAYKNSAERFVHATFAIRNGVYKPTLGTNGMLVGLALKVEHTSDEWKYINSENVRLALNIDIQSKYLHQEVNEPITSSILAYRRQAPAGFTLLMRCKLYGTNQYVTKADWSKNFKVNQLDCAIGNIPLNEGDVGSLGLVTIDNRPNTVDGFREEENTIVEGYDYQVTFIGTDTDIKAGSIFQVWGETVGDYAWATDTKKLYRIDYGGGVNEIGTATSLAGKILYYKTNRFAMYVTGFVKLDATTMRVYCQWQTYNFVIGQKLKIEDAVSDGNNGTFVITEVGASLGWASYTNPDGVGELGSGATLCGLPTRMFKVTDPGGLVDATEGTDYENLPTLYGRDLFDISDLFGETPQWQNVEQIELFVVNHDFQGTISGGGNVAPWINEGDYSMQWDIRIAAAGSGSIRQGGTPALYTVEQMSITDKPIFATVQGRVKKGTSEAMVLASDIVSDILDQIYPRKYDESSLTALFSDTVRTEWKFRRQFTGSEKVTEILRELLFDLWSVAVFDENDNIVFKSLVDTGVNDPSLPLLDDSVIIKDSIKDVRFRDANEIYQKFIIQYGYRVPSEFSKAQEPFDKSMTISETEGDASLSTLINRSKDLYNLENVLTIPFMYHYEDSSVNSIIDQYVNFYAFNSWSFKLEVTIEKVLNPSPIRIMDVVRFQSSFFSNDEILTAFVVSIKPDIYEGVAELGLYVVSPSGKFGPMCDPFNDALHVPSRNISGWTDGNGQRNDAGDVTTRSIGDYTQKDAGDVETRTFECD